MRHLKAYKQRVEEELLIAIEKMGAKSPLRDSCAYALTTGGKRLRPLIVLSVADALGYGLDPIEAALSVEYFHTASLIADDLPCMDDDDFRRSRPSVHKAFGESVAILSSYTLIAAGYGGIYENGKKLERHPRFCAQATRAVSLALEVATRCAGLQGATQGQYYDLFPPNLDWDMVQKIIYLKTVTLFEVSFLFGWVFGGGTEGALPQLKACAYHLGMAFQIADDLRDGDKGAASADRQKAVALFEKSMRELKGGLQEIGLWTPPFQELYQALSPADFCGKLPPAASLA